LNSIEDNWVSTGFYAFCSTSIAKYFTTFTTLFYDLIHRFEHAGGKNDKKSPPTSSKKNIPNFWHVGNLLNEQSIWYLYFQRYVENSNVGSCLNELISLEHCEVRARQKVRASEALFTALENIFEAVEITNSDHEIEVSIEHCLLLYVGLAIKVL
jgi:hypothetical protein